MNFSFRIAISEFLFLYCIVISKVGSGEAFGNSLRWGTVWSKLAKSTPIAPEGFRVITGGNVSPGRMSFG